MSQRWRLGSGAFGVALSLGLVACSEGCSRQELPVSQPEFGHQRMDLDGLEALLWPKTDERWEPLSEPRLLIMEGLITLLLREAERGSLTSKQRQRVASMAESTGLELHEVEVELGAELERLWVVVEPPDDRRGRGSYLIRLGKLEPRARGPRLEYLLEAPHARFDKYTGTIALALFCERDPAIAPPRALFVNSVHRHTSPDGTREKHEQSKDNLADAAHQVDHPLARATAAALRERPMTLVQLHGFERDAGSGDPDIIVASGEAEPNPASAATRERLEQRLPEFSVAHYGDGADRLGAKTNVQGAAARAAKRCFVHVESSAAVRDRLRVEPKLRQKFAAALFDGQPEERRRGCE